MLTSIEFLVQIVVIFFVVYEGWQLYEIFHNQYPWEKYLQEPPLMLRIILLKSTSYLRILFTELKKCR